ncbi:MAG: HDIG domain-containing protein, partial [Nitrospinae bacterium]|nr:HDIG domain-containing protein [Nitrospinota bacterium]
LARVSSYYHDIGKIKMPEYFVENQSNSLGKHENLTPHMSSMIISSHVKEGVELANQYKLPQPIIDIIEQHHGTSLMTFFYQKAKGQRDENEPSEEEYKYPGPKPQTRVAALVMMADAVEAASKVLNDPTPARVAALVDKIINHIFLEGQLDECELTLKDISEIKKHFSYILTGILHKRIDYPAFDFNGEASKSQEAQRQINEGSNREQAKTYKDKPAKDKA